MGIRNTDALYGKGLSRATLIFVKACAILSSFVPHTIVCVANKAKETHIAQGYNRKKMTVIGNGFDTIVFKPQKKIRYKFREELGITDDTLVIGSVGRFNEYKDHRNFICSAGKIAIENKNVLFLLAGRGLDLKNNFISQWISETGFSDRFILLGERSDIASILNAIDVFCLHSISEGFPNVLGEAMSVGLPSVVTDVGDAGLLLGEAGLLVPPGNTEALTKGLLDMIGAPKEKHIFYGNVAGKG